MAMEIERPEYINKLISAKDNGRVKVITGLRRCGKTYIVKTLFPKWLIENGISRDNIVYLALDTISNAQYRNPLLLDKYLREIISSKSGRCYIIIDELRM